MDGAEVRRAMRRRVLLCALGGLVGPGPVSATPSNLFEVGPSGCAPRGVLAKLLAEEPACALDFDACRAAPVVAGGTPLASEELDALEALVSWGDGGFTVRCVADGPRFLFQMAIKGLAYSGAKDRLASLLALADPAALPKVGENVRRLLAEAFVWLDDPRAGPALAALVALPVGNPDFKPAALFALARLGDAAAVPACEAALAEDAERLGAACAHYLAAVRPEGALATLEKAATRHPEAVARALPAFGADAAPLLRRLAQSGDLRVRVAAQVSLVEVGDDTYLGSLTAALQAPERLRRERLERYKKAAKRLKKKKARQKKRRRRGRDMAPVIRAAPRPSKALIKEMAALEQAARVALECGRITRSDVADRLDRALWQAARAEYELRWRAHTNALLGLAQRGDTAAIARLGEVLAGATDPLREALLEGIGALWLEVDAPGDHRGRGVVAAPALLPVLASLADEAETFAQRQLALRAMLAVRTASAPRGAPLAP